MKPVGMPSFGDLVIRVSDQPNPENYEAFCNALLTTTVFVKLAGIPEHLVPGQRYVVRGSAVRMPYVKLPNGMRMVRVSATAPRIVAKDEVVATMTGLETLEMVMKSPEAQGLLVAAEDERDSWAAIERDGIASILEGVGSGRVGP